VREVLRAGAREAAAADAAIFAAAAAMLRCHEMLPLRRRRHLSLRRFFELRYAMPFSPSR